LLAFPEVKALYIGPKQGGWQVFSVKHGKADILDCLETRYLVLEAEVYECNSIDLLSITYFDKILLWWCRTGILLPSIRQAGMSSWAMDLNTWLKANQSFIMRYLCSFPGLLFSAM
jgi:hypothetical protein